MPAVCNRGILEKRRGQVYNGHVQKKKEDGRMEKRITPDELADMLMRRVYVPFSAVAAVNGRAKFCRCASLIRPLRIRRLHLRKAPRRFGC